MKSRVLVRTGTLLLALILVHRHAHTQDRRTSTPSPSENRTAIEGAQKRLEAAWETFANQSGTDTKQVRRNAIEVAQKRLERAWEELSEKKGRGEFSMQPLQAKPFPAAERVAAAAQPGPNFIEPEEIRSSGGQLIVTLSLMKAHNRLGEDPVYLRSYNGKLVGPTLRARPGDTLRITLRNDLDPEIEYAGNMNKLHSFNTTNLHTHGLHVSPAGISDNVLLEVPPGSTQKYEIVIPRDHPAGTFWYHAHRHGAVAGQVASGASGALIISGGMDDVPEIAKARDRVFVLQQIPYLYKNVFKDETGKITASFDLPEGLIEPQYQDYIFGPGTWDSLGRLTTLNGVEYPVIRVRPGSIERWRFIDSALREPLLLSLVRVDASDASAPKTLQFHEIAVDGLPLGKLDEKTQIELWPGYRSDNLIKFPESAGVEYILRDERPVPSGTVIPKERRYIARVIIEGDAQPMGLPDSKSLAQYRLKSLGPKTGDQTATYGIIRKSGGGIEFTIDRKPYSDKARQLKLGDIDEWTLTSKNEVGGPKGVSHPFHIHVNPFEVFSILNRDGVEQLKEPIWRDTIILHEGWKVKFRTQYNDFLGMFVQHCHILDHEDQGMMELLEVVDPKDPPASAVQRQNTPPIRLARPYHAPTWELPDTNGRLRRLADFTSCPTVVLLFEGYNCLRCARQLAAFAKYYRSFRENGINVVGISANSLAGLHAALDSGSFPFPLLADAQHRVFRDYGCFAESPLHGTFLIDSSGLVRWQTVSTRPFLGVDTILKEALRLNESDIRTVTNVTEGANSLNANATQATGTPRVQLEVWNTPTNDDDYITWAPTPCRIRLVPGSAAADVQITLTNDPPHPIPAGRDLPLDGDVLFDKSVETGKTAQQKFLQLTLPKDGAWVPFFIAGKFPQASTEDKDCIIEVHQGQADGQILYRHPLMVRIRKDHRKLTDHERQRFLEALDHLHRGTSAPNGESRYMYFVRMHQAAAKGLDFDPDNPVPIPKYYWPDLAHKGPGFIAWHRAFLLQFERELQKTHPDVALPYWVMPELSKLFSEDFMGANPVLDAMTPVDAKFGPNNPLFDWTADIDGVANERLKRWALGRNPSDPSSGFGPFRTDSDLFKYSQFSLYPKKAKHPEPEPYGFVDAMERDPHNSGHNLTGPWMQNCQTSPRDPIFWVFHAGYDRQWAHWQYLYDRFNPNGVDSYCPSGDFQQPGPVCGSVDPGHPQNCNDHVPNPCVPITHHLKDKLWPWSGRFGKGQSDNESLPQEDLAKPFVQPFPTAPIPGLWPSGEAQPTPGDMIDYLGITPGRLPMGFAYDDTPYGKEQPSAAKPKQSTAEQESLQRFGDRKRTVEQRLSAAARIDPAAVSNKSKLDSVLKIVRSQTEDDAVRVKALQIADAADLSSGIDEAIRLLKSPPESSAALSSTAVNLLATNMMLTAEGNARKAEIMPALEEALSDEREPVRLAALWALIPMPHGDMAVAKLVESLREPARAPFAPLNAIKGLSLAHRAVDHAALIRPYLRDSSPEIRAAAVFALAADSDSMQSILDLLQNPEETYEVRSNAIHALVPAGGSYRRAVLNLVANPKADIRLRAEGVGAIGVLVRSSHVSLSASELDEIIDRLTEISNADAQRIGSIVGQTVLNGMQRVKQLRKK